jgi:hypothetical protein
MNCQSYSEDLTAYLDGELSRSRAEAISAHLRECGPCSQELRELRRAGEFVEAHALSLEPQSHLWNNLRGRIGAVPEQEVPPRLILGWFAQRWLAAAASLAAAVVLALGIWGYLGYRQSERSLQDYMSSYIQRRESERKMPSAEAGFDGVFHAAAFQGAAPHNPFAATQSVSFDNPFRSGER